MSERTEAITPAQGGRGVLAGAFALLEQLTHSDEVGLSELARTAGVPKSTAYRLLGQLVAEGAVERRAGRYRLGPRVFRLGQTWQPAHLLRTASAEPMRQLAARGRHGTYAVAVADRGRIMIVGAIGRELDAVMPLRAGALLPPGGAAAQILSPTVTEYTPPEGISRAEWLRLTTAARARGLAYDMDIRRRGIVCVAAPVHGPEGEVVAALGAATLEPHRLTAMADPVQRAAGVMTANLARLLRTRRSLSL
ncbi:IclR family transcriptional regulator [Nocardia sp. NPDC052566]|uniref:IclR family transcriptional regulator n=1 Tax=Nocardia sp. NPDC052566 TaxID=3364330 RepID=UPI0037C83BFB